MTSAPWNRPSTDSCKVIRARWTHTGLARNIDSQTKRGREISRNMGALLDCVRELRQMDQATMGPEDDEATRKLLEMMKL